MRCWGKLVGLIHIFVEISVFCKCILYNRHKLEISTKILITPNSRPQHLISDRGGLIPGNLMIFLHEMLSAKANVETENDIKGISVILQRFKHF